MSIARHAVTLVLLFACTRGFAHAQPQRLALPPDALALSELLHAVLPELRESTAQLQLARTDDGWRFRTEPTRLGRPVDVPAEAEGEARMSMGRLSRLTIRHAQTPSRVRRGGSSSRGNGTDSTPSAANHSDASDSPSAIRTRLAAAATAKVGAKTDTPRPGVASPAPAPVGEAPSEQAQAITAQDALDFVTPGLRTALGHFDANGATFTPAPSLGSEWRFEILAAHGDAVIRYRLEFDPVTGRLVSIEER